jgi:predicted transcriptional regulator
MLMRMSDLKLHLPATEEVVIDDQTSMAIDRGITDADHGRSVLMEEVREMIPKWISKFESQKKR